MSTDYGYGCVTCGEHAIIDNFREPRSLVALLPYLEALSAVEDIKLERIELFVGIQSHYYDFTESWKMALRHQRLGHDVTAYDEYGMRWSQCNARVPCACCDESNWCGFDQGHDGPHRTPGMVRRDAKMSTR